MDILLAPVLLLDWARISCLRDIEKATTSINDSGTFDGIVLSRMAVAYLA